MNNLYKQACFELRKIASDPYSPEGQVIFAENALDEFYNTFDGWKSKGKCINKGEKSIFDKYRKIFIFHSSQLKPNYGESEYCPMDEMLGTNHFGI